MILFTNQNYVVYLYIYFKGVKKGGTKIKIILLAILGKERLIFFFKFLMRNSSFCRFLCHKMVIFKLFLK